MTTRTTGAYNALSEARQQKMQGDPMEMSLLEIAMFRRANAYPGDLHEDDAAFRRHLCQMFLADDFGENQFLDMLASARVLVSLRSVLTFYARGVLADKSTQ